MILLSRLAFIVVFLSVFLGCDASSTRSQPEQVCTLTADQIPEIRGLRLGMPRQEIDSSYPNAFQISNSLSSHEEDLGLKEFNQLFPFAADKERHLKVYRASSGSSSQSLDADKYPRFEGIWSLMLTFVDDRLEVITMDYVQSTDPEFPKVFRQRTLESLGLTSFTNWTNGKNIDSSLDSFSQVETVRDTLMCDGLEVSLQTWSSEGPNINSSYKPLLQIKNRGRILKAETERALAEEKRRLEQEQRQDADQKRTETFTP
jgi:hypothetical protein